MSCKFKITWPRRRRQMYYGCKLPAGYVAQYFFKQAPSTNGLIIDESGNGNDVQLVQSNCLAGDGAVYAKTVPVVLHNGTNFRGGFIVNNRGNTGSIGGKWLPTANRELTFYLLNSTTIRMFYSSDGVMEASVDFTVSLGWITLLYEFKNGILDFVLNGVSGQYNLGITEIHAGLSELNILAQTGGLFRLDADVAWFKHGDAEFNCAEGGKSTILHNVGIGGDATILAFNMPTLWGKQDVYHYNIKGFDLWTNGVVGEEIRVPIGATVIEAGYTFVSTNPGGAWHNNAESALQLPATLKTVIDGDIVNPPFYGDWQVLYGTPPNYSALSNIEENKHKSIVFYDKFLTNTEIEKALKCIKETQHLWDDAEIWNDTETWID